MADEPKDKLFTMRCSEAELRRWKARAGAWAHENRVKVSAKRALSQWIRALIAKAGG